jgi:hypothetical protein
MDYSLPRGKAEDIQQKLEEIGELSLAIIKDREKYSKDELWEKAVAINKLGQEIHKDLSYLGSFFFLFPQLELHVPIYSASLHLQLQSATGHLSDEQQSAPQAQSQHPEFPQLQPITNSDAQISNSSFFILNISIGVSVRLLNLAASFHL